MMMMAIAGCAGICLWPDLRAIARRAVADRHGVAASLMAPLTAFASPGGAIAAAPAQFLDADDRLAGHAGVDGARATPAAADRLARPVLAHSRR